MIRCYQSARYKHVSAITVTVLFCLISNSLLLRIYFVKMPLHSSIAATCVTMYPLSEQKGHELIVASTLITLVKVCFGTVIYVTQIE
jgi:hypothetical protein